MTSDLNKAPPTEDAAEPVLLAHSRRATGGAGLTFQNLGPASERTEGSIHYLDRQAAEFAANLSMTCVMSAGGTPV